MPLNIGTNTCSVTHIKLCVIWYYLTLLHSERPKLNGVLAILSAIGLNAPLNNNPPPFFHEKSWQTFHQNLLFIAKIYSLRAESVPPFPAIYQAGSPFYSQDQNPRKV